MVSKVEKSEKSSTSKSVVKSIRSVFLKKSKSKNEASNVTAVEDELVKESTISENIDDVSLYKINRFSLDGALS
jgi:hypothetical protein